MSEQKRPWRWLLALLLIGFALRVFRLEAQSLWWDEGISLHLATSSWLEIMADRVVNIHPPGYFFLLKVWVSLVGTSPFVVRYLSVLAGVVQITAVYVVARRWLWPRATWAAVGLITVSPLSVIYAQETRVYALLPLIYLGVLLLTSRFLAARPGRWRGLLVGLGLIEWVGIHLHYISAFVVIYAGIWVLWVLGRRRAWPQLRVWLAAQVAVGVASLPWFGAVVWNATAVEAEANAGTFVADIVPLDFLLSQIWTFHFTGLAGVLGEPAFRWLALATAVLFGVALLLQLGQKAGRRPRLVWLANWLIPLSSALLVWSVRSFAHPRYVSIFAVGLILVLAALVAPGRQATWPQRGTGVLLGAATLGLFGLALQGYFYDPRLQKDDVRGAAAYLTKVAQPDDLILIPNTDWSLPFEYQGETPVYMPNTEEPAGVFGEIAAQMPAGQRVYQLDYPRGTRDWQNVVGFALEQAGTLTAVTRFDGVVVRTYELAGLPDFPEATDGDGLLADFGPVQLRGGWVEGGAAADTAVTIALHWQVAAPPSADWSVSLALETVAGVPTTRSDAPLRDGFGRPTSLWAAGQQVTTYHVVALPPATPPVAHRAQLTVYGLDAAGVVQVIRPLAGEAPAETSGAVALAQTMLGPPRGWTETPYGETLAVPLLPQPVVADSGLALLGWAVNKTEFAPGEWVFVTLLWQAQKRLPALSPVVALTGMDGPLVVAEGEPVDGRYPTNDWLPGQIVREVRTLPLPAAAGGVAALTVAFDGEEVTLREVTVAGVARSFTPPQPTTVTDAVFGGVARLVGVDLPKVSVVSGATLPVTLHWEALAADTAVNYRVFVHLVDGNGVIVAQHDGPPAGGARPTSGWLAGEFVTDIHPIALGDVAFSGEAGLVVGLYDPQSGDRISLTAGGDSYTLPVKVLVDSE